MSKAIFLKDVVKEYGQEDNVIRALDGVNMEIGRGVMAAVIGPSGSGKTTLLNMLGALDKPTAGEVQIDGRDIGGMMEGELTAYRRQKVGFVFQDFNLIPNLSALENVALPMEFAGLSKGEREARAKELLDAVKMGHRSSHRPGKLSGGEQQRVAIARALANDPAIILADEPTGNLDTKIGEEIVRLLKRFSEKEGKTVVVVTHDSAIQELADLTIQIKDGKIGEGE
jgi:putative ABC transport system ATP-binding protein